MNGRCESCGRLALLGLVVAQGEPFAVCAACAPQDTHVLVGQQRAEEREQ